MLQLRLHVVPDLIGALAFDHQLWIPPPIQYVRRGRLDWLKVKSSRES
jgi:hypothetical protein